MVLNQLPQPCRRQHACLQALFNPGTSRPSQKRQPFTENLTSEPSGDIKNAFLHSGDVLAV